MFTRETIEHIIDILVNIKVTYWDFPFSCHKNQEWVDLIRINKKYKDIHRGCRCFILGNGPSLNQENLRVLGKEYVFSVNQIARHPDFKYIKPNYHFWADPNFFQIDEEKPEDMELLEVMKRVNTSDNKPVCFFPIEQLNVVKKFHLDQELVTGYYYSHLHLYDGYKKNIDY